jgi:hypothetical protein
MITINGNIIPERCTALEGLTYIHVYLQNMSSSTKNLIESLQDETVSFCYFEADDMVYEYPKATLLYLGNNTIYVCSSMN